jgi:hypothetical protein
MRPVGQGRPDLLGVELDRAGQDHQVGRMDAQACFQILEARQAGNLRVDRTGFCRRINQRDQFERRALLFALEQCFNIMDAVSANPRQDDANRFWCCFLHAIPPCFGCSNPLSHSRLVRLLAGNGITCVSILMGTASGDASMTGSSRSQPTAPCPSRHHRFPAWFRQTSLRWMLAMLFCQRR